MPRSTTHPNRKRKAKAAVDGKGKGALVIIGGREDRTGKMEILREVAQRAHGGKLVIASVASELPNELWADYRKVFRQLGVKKLEHLNINRPEEARHDKSLRILDGVTAIFFTGGD